MQSTRVTRSTVLGKRGHQDQESVPPSKAVDQLQTPDPTPNPKRTKTSAIAIDGEGNKENIPPYRLEAINAATAPITPRAARALRRTATQVVVTTPSHQSVRRRASTSAVPSTPSRENAEPSIATPPATPPTVLLPLHARVKALLRATCNKGEMSVSGRENERATIQRFLDSFSDSASMQDDAATSLFISGSPGTGKTALVNSMIQTVEDTSMITIFINCMSLKTVDALLNQVVEELRARQGQTSRAKKAKVQNNVNALLKSLGGKCLLILDELDHIASNWHSLVSLFALSDSTSNSLRIIGIANTHTLTADSTGSYAPSISVQTLHFAPYTPAQLQSILQTRLVSLYEFCEADMKKLLPDPPIVLLTKKIANLTGDVRSLFEVLRGAIDLAVAAANVTESNPMDTPAPSVTPPHVLAALKAYAPSSSTPKAPAAVASAPSSGNSEITAKIRNLGLQSRLALLSILLAAQRVQAGLTLSAMTLGSPRKPSPIKRTSSAPVPSTAISVGIDTQQLYIFYTTVLDQSELGALDAVSRSDFGDLLGVLEGVGLVQMSSSSILASPSKGKRAFSRSMSFGAGLGRAGAGTVGEVKLAEGVWTNEVLRGLGISETPSDSSDLQNEEVKGLWVSESNRLSKDIKALAVDSVSKDHVASFEDAFER